MADMDLIRARDLLVCQSNDLIQKTKYDLSAQQLKIIKFLASKVKPEDTDFKEYEFDLDYICDIFSIQKQTSNFKVLSDNIDNLQRKLFRFENDEIKITYSWITKAIIDKKNRKVFLQLHKDLKPFMLQMQSGFTQYELSNVLALSGKYSIRFYDLLKSYVNLGEITIPLEEIKKHFQCEKKYDDFRNFRRNVVEPAIEEINAVTNITVSVEYIKYKKVVVELLFKIREKRGEETFMMLEERERRLGNE